MVESIGSASRGGDFAWVGVRARAGQVREAWGEGDGVRELCRSVRGLSILEAAAIPGPVLATDALHDALAPVASARPDARRVTVAMSGGVDSAVALLQVRERGQEPVGVTLRLWADPAGPSAERACCSPAAVLAARETCHGLRVPHFTLDLREDFRRVVVAPFVAAYANGETPNPCVRCNGTFRFAELLAFTRRIGARKLVTGHYARLVEHRGRLLLARGVDPAKDQSYMLARLDPRHLSRLWFPLGGQAKSETREQARAAGLAAGVRAESQEACFLAGGDYRDFLGRHGLEQKEGPIVDASGRELARHAGFWRFTPGQRRGLGVATGAPVYAVRTNPGTNAVVVGPREELARTSVTARPGRLFVPVERAEVKLRYRSVPTTAEVSASARGFRLALDDPVYGVAPGQAAVLYEGDAVVGAGIVSAAK